MKGRWGGGGCTTGKTLTQHLLLLVQRSSGQHGGGQRRLSLNNNRRLQSREAFRKPAARFHPTHLQLYLLHGDLRLSVDVLLGVPDSCGVLVLGDPPNRIGCYGSGGGGCPGTHGLGGCKGEDGYQHTKPLQNFLVFGATVTMAILPQHKPSEIQLQGTWRGGSERTGC